MVVLWACLLVTTEIMYKHAICHNIYCFLIGTPLAMELVPLTGDSRRNRSGVEPTAIE